MYDLNGDGMITKTELANVLVAVCELMGIDMSPPLGGKIVNGNLLCKFSLQGRQPRPPVVWGPNFCRETSYGFFGGVSVTI